MGGDCTIVGAGPVGLFLAQQLKDLDVTVYEEHKKIGKPVQCTGLISKNIDSVYEIPQECILNKVKGARIYSPSGKKFELARDQDQAYVIDREKFDKKLAEGINIQTKHVSDLNFESKYIIGADGPNSIVARLSGLKPIKEKLVGLQYEIPIEDYGRDFIEMYFGDNFAPGFFAWIVPAGDRLRVGAATNTNVKEYLDNFLKNKFEEPEILSTNAGVIPISVRPEFTNGNIAVVGDAAGQVKATTGGGVYFGFKSAKILANSIKKNNLESYEKNWQKEFFWDFSLGRRIRNRIKKMSDNEMNNLWDLLNKEEIKKVFAEHGDMDHPTKLLKAFVKNPMLWKYTSYLKYLF